MNTRVSRTLPIVALFLFLPVTLLSAADPVPFIRGDANADGFLSTADLLTIERWLFAGDEPPSCIDAADVNDDGRVDICDSVGVAAFLFQVEVCTGSSGPAGPGSIPPAPFPAPGDDPTPDVAPYMSCNGFTVTPAEATDDLLRLGDVEAGGAGVEVEIPVHVTAARPVEAVQLVVRYDPTVVRIASGHEAITYQGTYYEQFKGQRTETQNGGHGTYGEPFTFAYAHAADGFFTASIVPDLLVRGTFAVPAGAETLVAKIRATVSPDVSPGTLLRVDPLDGPDGQGYGPFRLRNEFTYEGEGRYPTIAPRTEGALLRIGVDGDISFFVRGDANGDEQVDVSDPIAVLGFLFLDGGESPCLDAADADDDGTIVITDAIAVLNTLFLGSRQIAPPYPAAGADVNPDFLRKCSKGLFQ